MRGLLKRLARTPLWARLVAGTLMLVTLALTLTGLFGVNLLRGYLVDRVDEQLVRTTHMPDWVPVPQGNRPPHLPGSFFGVVLDPTGAIVYRASEVLEEPEPSVPQLTPGWLAQNADRPITVDAVTGGDRWRMIVDPMRAGYVRVFAANMGEIDNTVTRLVVIDVGVGTIVLIGLGFAGYWLVRRSLRPLGEIERVAGAIAGGDLSRRVPNRHPRTEMGRLGRAINGMLAQIEAAFRARTDSEAEAVRSAYQARVSEDRMRQFVADASHELRTPLTSIRGFSELYRQEGAPSTEEASRLMRRIEDEALRMGLLVDDLLLLARLDQQRPLQQRPVDLLSLAAEAVLDAQALTPDREIDLVRLDDSEGPVMVTGDEARLHQVLGNLISNVLKHTPPDTPFRVGVGIVDGSAVLEVADEGPGLPANEAEKIFERFYRADPSRSRAHGGSGLGLSIAAALVKAHKGTISLETAPGKGATFRVQLPI